MSPYEILVRFIEANMSMSGTMIAVTLTAFIFLITRAPNSLGESDPTGAEAYQAELRIIGPFSILYSFLTSFVAYVLFSIMSRVDSTYFSSPSVGANELGAALLELQ